MPQLNAADAVIVHKAIHTKPMPAAVTTTIGILNIMPNAHGNGSVELWHDGPRMVGGNPTKESSYARKMRAGGAVTLINPGGSKGFEPKCVVIESLTPSSEPTVVSGLHFRIPGVLGGLGSTANLSLADTVPDADAASLNVGDRKRMYVLTLQDIMHPLPSLPYRSPIAPLAALAPLARLPSLPSLPSLPLARPQSHPLLPTLCSQAR